MQTSIYRCPRCTSSIVYYRIRSDDYICRRCGNVFDEDDMKNRQEQPPDSKKDSGR